MLTYNHNIITHNNKWFNEFIGHPEPVYNVYTSGQGGQVIATPNSGVYGTYVTLSNTPDTNYVFESYSITGAPWYNRESFYMQHNDAYVEGKFKYIDPYNPLDLPPNTIRVRTNDGNVPIKGWASTYQTATLVDGTSDVYDVYKSGTSFYSLLQGSTNVIEVLGGNTTNITNMEVMFSGASSLTTVAVFDTSNVTNMERMFHACHTLTSIPLFDTSNVINMHGMFESCDIITSIPLFNTSNVTDMQFMFGHCAALTTVPLFDTSNVTNMYSMFHYCESFINIPLFNTSNVITMFGMFSNCTSLTTVPLFDTSKVTDMAYMFANCYAVESDALALYNQASTQTNPPTEHTRTFYNCGRDTTTGAAELAQIPSDWK